MIRRERENMLSLMRLGLSSEQTIELLTHTAIARAQSPTAVLDGLFDASDRAEGGDVIGWMNDFETDERCVSLAYSPPFSLLVLTHAYGWMAGMRGGALC